ncbi:ATP-binding protein [Mucilaginibacter sp. PPCGB 2223]|uniref:tetratricopeptide repeat-containing sensor histidine kinase n=1 Tax=Mucilaginibacter sp. PPCGB 2223 TaxID=1886027 RepID=UPI0020C7B17F|nr:ATP-binding protein [Mucilaginibacter sp. PPCGB 2223]
MIQKHPNDPASIHACVDYAGKFFYTQSDSAFYYLNKAMALAKRTNNNIGYAYCLKNEGDLYAINGESKKAVMYYKQGLAAFKKSKENVLYIKILSNLAITYKNLGALDSAMQTFDQVSAAFKNNLHTHQDSIALAVHYIQLFDTYRVQGFKDDALFYGEKAYTLSKTINYERGIGYGLYVEGLKYYQADPALALKYCNKALDIAVLKNISELQVFVRSLKADIFINAGKYRQAEEELLKDTHYTAGSIRLVTNSKLAKVYYYLKDYQRALGCYQYAITLAYGLGYRSEIASTLENGIDIYQKLGNYKTAFVLLKKHEQVQSEMASDKLKLDYERSALKFRAAEKDKQLAQNRLTIEEKDNRLKRQSLLIMSSIFIIVLLIIVALLIYHQQKKLQAQRIKNLESAKKIQMLDAAMSGEEKERKRIAENLHDGIGGLLSAVKMRFSIFKNEYPELKASGAYNKAIAMLDDASAEIRKTAHNLMPDMLVRFGLDEALQVFCDNLNQFNQLKIRYECIGEIGRFNKNVELMIYRMVQELINNTIKHSNAKNAYVQLSRQRNVLSVSIEDDGCGFDKQSLQTAKGMGLNAIEDRINSLGGMLEIDSTLGNGVYIYFELDILDFNIKSNR